MEEEERKRKGKGRPSSHMFKGRVLRIGTYAIASSITDHCITCTTFNILAPIYKRISDKDQCSRESDYPRYWIARNQMILDWLLNERSTIICLQEFWIDNEEFVNMYEKRLGDAGYIHFKLARANNRGDGLLTAIHKDHLRVINNQDLILKDMGDRVAQLLHVELLNPFFQTQSCNVHQEILIVNTHLLFPHDSSLCVVRLHQVYEILRHVETYRKQQQLNPMAILLCGDWNGSKRGHVYKFLRSQGFVSSYDLAHQYTDDAHKWISHRNHLGNNSGVDFIWLLNPNMYKKVLKASWNEAVFSMFKTMLRRASLTESDAYTFLKASNGSDHVTYPDFCEALKQLNITGHSNGVSEDEIKELWAQADIDGNGILDYNEFLEGIWSPTWSEVLEETSENSSSSSRELQTKTVETIGFSVKNAVLFPTEVEKGVWPEEYTLSDHARLTIVLSPLRMPCPQLNF